MKHVPADQLTVVWDWVQTGLARTRAKIKADWRPEDVYLSLRLGHAFLYIVPGVGFYVFKRLTDPDGRLVLFVWIVCGDFKTIHVEQFQAVDDLARSIGAKCVRWESPRNWRRFGEVKYYGYEREV